MLFREKQDLIFLASLRITNLGGVDLDTPRILSFVDFSSRLAKIVCEFEPRTQLQVTIFNDIH